MKSVLDLARPDIVALAAYQPARWEPELERLHANEMPWRPPGDESAAGLNRYPDPAHLELDRRLATLYEVAPDEALATRGSDEAIDLLVRCFCRAERDAVLVCPPTFSMYETAAVIQGARVVEAPLRAEAGFALDVDAVLARCTPDVKLVFVCTPNNPTGNVVDAATIAQLAESLEGRAVLVLDEAYAEFTGGPSPRKGVAAADHVVSLRTCSKAYALAGARIGTLVAAPAVVALARKVQPPYALTQPSIEAAMRALEPAPLAEARARIEATCRERERLAAALAECPGVRQVWPSAANFLLVRFDAPSDALARARSAGLLVRDVRKYPGLEHALRITVGTPAQHARLLESLS